MTAFLALIGIAALVGGGWVGGTFLPLTFIKKKS